MKEFVFSVLTNWRPIFTKLKFFADIFQCFLLYLQYFSMVASNNLSFKLFVRGYVFV